MGLLSIVLKNVLRKPVTKGYPREKPEIPANSRGTIYVDEPKCIGCNLCNLNCPTGAIALNQKKKADVDCNLCILCGMCAQVCPVKCIGFTNKYENAVKDKKLLMPEGRR